MNKEVGKVYTTGRTYVLCSGHGINGEFFSGIVVKQTDETSHHQVGVYSSSWTNGRFKETDTNFEIDNYDWIERFNLDETPNDKVF